MKKFKNFKVVGLFLPFVLIAILIIGCEEVWGPIGPEDPPIVTVKYTVTASVIGEGGSINPEEVTVNKGSDVLFNLHSDPGYAVDTLWVDGYVSTPTTPTTFNLENVTSDGSNVEVKFKKTPLWYLIQKPWTLVSLTDSGYMIGQGDYYWEADLNGANSSLAHTATFTPNWVKSYDLNGDVRWDYPYEVTEDSLFIEGRGPEYQYKIVELTEDRLVLKCLMGYGDETGQLGYLNSVEVWEHE